MNWLEHIKAHIPDYAKDVRLNLENVILRSSLSQEDALGCAIAAAVASGNNSLARNIATEVSTQISDAALAAAAIMAQNNVWYPYVEMTGSAVLKGLPAQLRMNVIGTHGGTTKAKFEAFSLSASIVGRCHFCVKAHYENLIKEGYTSENLRDIGRIAAVVNAVVKVINN